MPIAFKIQQGLPCIFTNLPNCVEPPAPTWLIFYYGKDLAKTWLKHGYCTFVRNKVNGDIVLHS